MGFSKTSRRRPSSLRPFRFLTICDESVGRCQGAILCSARPGFEEYGLGIVFLVRRNQ